MTPDEKRIVELVASLHEALIYSWETTSDRHTARQLRQQIDRIERYAIGRYAIERGEHRK